jgi:hypothetical protein
MYIPKGYRVLKPGERIRKDARVKRGEGFSWEKYNYGNSQKFNRALSSGYIFIVKIDPNSLNRFGRKEYLK